MTLKELYQKATPLPWAKRDPVASIGGGDGRLVFKPSIQRSYGTSAANSELAVHAVNVLPELVGALEEARELIWHTAEDGTEPRRYYRANEARRILPILEGALKKANHIEMKGETHGDEPEGR